MNDEEQKKKSEEAAENEEQKKREADGEDAGTDALVDDEIGCLAWFILHHRRPEPVSFLCFRQWQQRTVRSKRFRTF